MKMLIYRENIDEQYEMKYSMIVEAEVFELESAKSRYSKTSL